MISMGCLKALASYFPGLAATQKRLAATKHWLASKLEPEPLRIMYCTTCCKRTEWDRKRGCTRCDWADRL